MSNVIGNKKMIDWARKLPVGNRQCYINWEAISELPPQYEAVVTSIRFDVAMLGQSLDQNFTEVSHKYMPTTSMYYKIAEACGISGDVSKVEPLYEEIDINPMLCKDITEVPTIRKIKTGVSVTKQSKRLAEDGQYLLSSPCTNTYNAWDRCTNVWLKEEMYTDGYTKPAKYPPKYKSPYARKLHFSDELKLADQKSESKAYCKTIRELAGLPTAFERNDLINGVLVFYKIRRSAKALQLEQAARLSAINSNIPDNTPLLFDDDEQPPIEMPLDEQPPEVEEKTLLDTFKDYADIIDDNKIIPKVIEWLESVKGHEQEPGNIAAYKKAVKNLDDIEKGLQDPGQKIPHPVF